MKDHTEIEWIEEKAKREQREYNKAKKELRKALHDMHPQREHYTRQKSQNK